MAASPDDALAQRQTDAKRREVLERLEDWLEAPMVVLAIVWVALLVVELTWGESRTFEILGTIIWGLFMIEFATKFVLAPDKTAHLKSTWLTALSLLLPALRLFRVGRLVRVFRVARVGRGLRLVRVLTSLNRGMHALGATLSRRGFAYVSTLTLLVTFAGAAGMYAFERDGDGGHSLDSYGTALWWTAMLMTTMGSEVWPQTVEGRVLCFVLSLYAFTIFGYVTAMLATFFIGQDAARGDEPESPPAIVALRSEIAALRHELRARGNVHDLRR
jgi:voltage-gated potassium channel